MGLKFISEIVSRTGLSTFLFGNYSNTGWWYYFIAAFLIKTPLPTIIFALLSIGLLLKQRQVKLQEYFLLVPVIMFLIVSALSRMQLGLRYILPIYPFIFIICGKLFNEALKGGKLFKYITVLGFGWYLYSALMIFPHYLTYFNEIAGGPANGYKCLIDSNIDWGQDLPGLKTFIEKEGNPEIILSYFGSDSPRAYGIMYQDFYSYNSSERK